MPKKIRVEADICAPKPVPPVFAPLARRFRVAIRRQRLARAMRQPARRIGSVLVRQIPGSAEWHQSLIDIVLYMTI